MDLTEKIVYMLSNPDKVMQMGENAKTFVREEFNAGEYYQQLIKIYQRAIVKSKQHSSGTR